MSFFQCRAKRCKCNGKVRVVTGFGCPKGGIPDCPKEYELYCKDGTNLSPTRVMRHKMVTGRVQNCICKDGIMPRCKTTGDVPKCPGTEEEPDFSLGGAEDFIGCRVEYFDLKEILKTGS